MLTYVQTERDYTLYLDQHGNEIYLAHGPGMRRLVLFEDIDLVQSWNDWQILGRYDTYAWLESIRASITEPDLADEINWCDNCSRPGHQDDGICVEGDNWVCDSCSYYYTRCDRCEELVRETTTLLNDSLVCGSCCDNYYSYCDDCEGYYHNEDSDEHAHGGCNCDSPQLDFTIRNDGLPLLAQDERVTVNLPAGEISEEGIGSIAMSLYRAADRLERDERRALWPLCNTESLIEHIGAKWQTNRGNFTKRLSRYCYNDLKVKLDAATISEIGNIASTHCQGADYNIEVTRDLNLSAEDFGNEGSCWWGGYSSSRCALKSNGGFGLRSFEDDYVNGRAWVLPLKLRPGSDRELTPTFETNSPDAFVVFNGYGEMCGYIPARILAHMAGMTYRKIGFEASPMYVNAGGYLVASEALATHYTDGRIFLTLNEHAHLYDDERKELSDVA